MLVPALARRTELLAEFSKIMYSEGYFYYCGYAYSHELPNIEAADNYFQWACVSPKEQDVIGYIGYHVDPVTDSVDRFGIISFKEGNPLFAKDLFDLMRQLVETHHRLEWKCISGNPVMKHYREFCKEHKGQEIVLHDVCKDENGLYRNEHIFEIVRDRELNGTKVPVNKSIDDKIVTYVK